jgi:hypothetical protein
LEYCTSPDIWDEVEQLVKPLAIITNMIAMQAFLNVFFIFYQLKLPQMAEQM